jgi:hypothetical protein
MLNKSSRVWAPWFGMGCKAQTTAIAQLWRGFATPQTAQNRDDRAARDLFSVALTTGIYSINLGTGAATLLGNYNGTLSGLTVSAVPEPQTYALMLAGLVAVAGLARRRSR